MKPTLPPSLPHFLSCLPNPSSLVLTHLSLPFSSSICSYTQSHSSCSHFCFQSHSSLLQSIVTQIPLFLMTTSALFSRHKFPFNHFSPPHKQVSCELMCHLQPLFTHSLHHFPFSYNSTYIDFSTSLFIFTSQSFSLIHL